MNRFLTGTYIAAFCLFIPCDGVHSDELIVPIIGQPWCIFTETPKLSMFQGEVQNENFRYLAASEEGFNISVYVEKPASTKGEHADVYEHYWTRMKRNPLIDGETVETEKGERFVRIKYELKNVPANAPKYNANYFISFSGRWIDIHISVVSATAFSKICEDFEKSLAIRSLHDERLEPSGK